jgi:glyoxylase-like metal-dependent hydrolase (beta-lactamase superfamily II)
MFEEVLPELFRIRVPLPDSPLKYLNSYVFRSTDRSLIVDTGLNRTECLAAMEKALHALGLDRERCDFFITHLHADHFGLVGKLATPSSRIFFNRPDAELIESWEGFEPMIDYAAQNGFPENELRAALQNHPGFKHGSNWIPALQILQDGDAIDVGDYHLVCVHTPGHTLGHTCLYEPARKFLVAGDHILIDITPNIQCWSDRDDPLRQYLESLDKVMAMDIDLVLPGHRRLIDDAPSRIGELKAHHEKRLAEIETILETGPKTAFETAALMQWDIDCDRWEDFPVAQRWFATGEAISHLRYLETGGRIRRQENIQPVRFEKL